ncbi:tsl0368 [Thermosynechococcus vestitus BP-1]|uniref:Tsl0368 protein n=1 Tax=Thermosynechococcus vestitus (strain NIES-2133 / IAM M-273 / BP-1) TaxID=197221 RepID=Q8DLV8_THEVB|nr:tsl0368 [Thermosynechococcus vestitus BP-1]
MSLPVMGVRSLPLYSPMMFGAAQQIVKRMAHHMRELKIRQGDTAYHRYITVSAGSYFVTAGERQSTLTEILAIADAAVDQAKKQGRDRSILLDYFS